MNQNWHCRDYSPGDEYLILELFKQVFDRELPLSFWHWRFRDNPFGAGIIKLLLDGEKLIGHYAVSALQLLIDGQETPAVFSMTTMVHPDYRRQGIFPYLANQVYIEAARQGYRLVYGFPNKNSVHSFTQKLGWSDFGTMTALVGNITDLGSHRDFTVCQPDCYVEEWLGDFTKLDSESRIHVPRSAKYLQWRYHDCPIINYHPVAVIHNSNLVGLAILKLYFDEKRQPQRGHIVEWFCYDSVYTRITLLNSCYRVLQAHGFSQVSSWVADFALNIMLKNLGFVEEVTDFHFGYRAFTSEGQSEWSSKDDWYLTMGDCDVF